MGGAGDQPAPFVDILWSRWKYDIVNIKEIQEKEERKWVNASSVLLSPLMSGMSSKHGWTQTLMKTISKLMMVCRTCLKRASFTSLVTLMVDTLEKLLHLNLTSVLCAGVLCRALFFICLVKRLTYQICKKLDRVNFLCRPQKLTAANFQVCVRNVETNLCLTALTNGRIIKTVRETKGLTQNREGRFAERRSQWPRRRTSPALRLSPTASPMPTPTGIRTPPRCWATCLLRSRSRARLLCRRLVRWTRTLLTRFTASLVMRSPRRTLWRWASPRLPRLRRPRRCFASRVSWASLRRWPRARRSLTRRWLPSSHTSWASCKTALKWKILCFLCPQKCGLFLKMRMIKVNLG